MTRRGASLLALCTFGLRCAQVAASQVELSPSGIVLGTSGRHRALFRSSLPQSNAEPAQKKIKHCGRSASGFGVCAAYSDQPCCSSTGECGISDAHCKCDGCVDSRRSVPGEALTRWHTDVWRNACAKSRTSTAADGARLVPIVEYCPSCQVGHRFAPSSDTENAEVVAPTAAEADVAPSKWGACLMDWPEGQSGGLVAPSSVWRIDVLTTSSQKAPFIRWPCTSFGYLQLTGATVATRDGIARWARLMSAAQPDHFEVENALDIGANVGRAALGIGLFTTGRTLAIEMLPENFRVLNFFAEINPSLGIEAALIAVAPQDGKAEVAENGGRGKVVKFGSKVGIPAADPISFIGRNYGEEFLQKVGFVNVAVEGGEAAIIRSLMPLTQKALPAIHVELNAECRFRCGGDGGFSIENRQLFSVVSDIGYVAHDPDSGLVISMDSSCQEFEDGPASLLLLPDVALNRLGDLASRWRGRSADTVRYLGPLQPNA